MIEEQVEAREELIATLTKNHTRQIETLIKSITEATKEMMVLLKSENKNSGKPTTHILDNEVSVELKAEIKKNCSLKLVSPDNHRQNLVERAIQTFKSHFKAVLGGVDNKFLVQLWDKQLPQTVLT